MYASRSPKKRAGFALLLTLVVICLVGVVLASLSRTSLDQVVIASDELASLQRRWGHGTLARCLSQRVLTTDTPIREEIQLGQFRFVADSENESVKLNLNRSFSLRGKNSLVKSIAELTPHIGQVWLRPTMPTDNYFHRQPFEHWGQVFDLPRVSELDTQRITLWGDGRLHAAKVSRDVLEAALSSRVRPSIVTDLIRAREDGCTTVAEMLEAIEARAKEQAELLRWLSDISTAFTLNIKCSNDVRSWQHTHVMTRRRGMEQTF